MQLLGKPKQLTVLHMCIQEVKGVPRVTTNSGSEDKIAAAIDPILAQYNNIFTKPQQLPLKRSHDHRITLTVKPYQYPSAQKDIIEQMVLELLDSGVIRHNNSPYAFPIILVKKRTSPSICASTTTASTTYWTSYTVLWCSQNWTCVRDTARLGWWKRMCTRLPFGPTKAIMNI